MAWVKVVIAGAEDAGTPEFYNDYGAATYSSATDGSGNMTVTVQQSTTSAFPQDSEKPADSTTPAGNEPPDAAT